MSGKLVISLDFELQYGIEDFSEESLKHYQETILGGRKAIPELLKLFSDHHLHATWAMVGMIASENKEELQAYCPAVRPGYTSPMSIYEHPDRLGESEETDPFHYGSSLIRQILAVEGQEIGSHTFSHYYTQANGQTRDQFLSDLKAAQHINNDKIGYPPLSLVLPRNQVNPDYIDTIQEAGFKAFRGCQKGFVFNTPSTSYIVRGLRLLDTYFPVFGKQTYPISEIMQNGLANIRASIFYRPYNARLSFLEQNKLSIIKTSMEYAAKHDEVFHLWWHPHNLGSHTTENFANLKQIFDYYEELHERYGMESCNMKELYEEIAQ